MSCHVMSWRARGPGMDDYSSACLSEPRSTSFPAALEAIVTYANDDDDGRPAQAVRKPVCNRLHVYTYTISLVVREAQRHFNFAPRPC